MPPLQPILICLGILAFPLVVSSVANPVSLLSESAYAFPYFLLALVAFLGTKMRQRRTLALSVFLMIAYAFLLRHDGPGAPIAVATPLYLCLCFALRERKLSPRLELVYLVVAALPSLGLIAFSKTPWIARFTAVRIWGAVHFSEVPDLAILLCAAFAVLTVFESDRFLRDFRVFVLLGVVPIIQFLIGSSNRSPASEYLTLEAAAGFLSTGSMLFYGMFRLYWRKIYLDELTGIPNRRALNDRLNELKGEYSIIMTDIDHFKRINDNYGHAEGDHVLRYVARLLERESGHQTYRYGGEEFCTIWRHHTPTEAAERVEKIRQKLEDNAFVIRRRLPISAAAGIRQRGKDERTRTVIKITMSAGVASRSGVRGRAEDTLIAADQALYRAKTKGRNCVVVGS